MRGAWLVLFSIPLLAGCGPNFEKLTSICRNRGRLVIHEEAVWNAYVGTLRAEAQKYSRQEQDSKYMVLYPAPGFDFPSDFSRGHVQARHGIYQNNFYVTKDGRDAATIINYVLSWTGAASPQSADCVHNHPEVYGVLARDLGAHSK
jgi:hypothetical protein